MKLNQSRLFVIAIGLGFLLLAYVFFAYFTRTGLPPMVEKIAVIGVIVIIVVIYIVNKKLSPPKQDEADSNEAKEDNNEEDDFHSKV